MSELTFTIGEVARAINRVPHTIRVWEYHGRLPKHLLPSRDERGRRRWTQTQIDGLKQWIIDEDMRPGKAFRKKAES